MTFYDVFNGDADGICALQQLRLQQPRDAVLISGLKRDIALLSQVSAVANDVVTALDVSLDKNRAALLELLSRGVHVFYADHHYPGDIPQSELLDCNIDVAADTCTSLIINNILQCKQAHWAVVGAYGDNLDAAARTLGVAQGITETQLSDLQQLGICLNYNGYGFEIDDLLFHPIDLYQRVHPYSEPLDFIQNESAYTELLAQYRVDLSYSQQATAIMESATAAVYRLPNERWARRIVGVMGNDLAKRFPRRAHALLVDMGSGYFRVSVRAAYCNKTGADELCRQFSSGGGRRAAAGIDALSHELLPQFVERFNLQFENDA